MDAVELLAVRVVVRRQTWCRPRCGCWYRQGQRWLPVPHRGRHRGRSRGSRGRRGSRHDRLWCECGRKEREQAEVGAAGGRWLTNQGAPPTLAARRRRVSVRSPAAASGIPRATRPCRARGEPESLMERAQWPEAQGVDSARSPPSPCRSTPAMQRGCSSLRWTTPAATRMAAGVAEWRAAASSAPWRTAAGPLSAPSLRTRVSPWLVTPVPHRS